MKTILATIALAGAFTLSLADSPRCLAMRTLRPTVDFGSVVVGEDSVRTGKLVNLCNYSVQLSIRLNADSNFVARHGIIVLIPAKTRSTYPMAFTPKSAGNHQGTLAFSSSVNSFSFTLKGNGIASGTDPVDPGTDPVDPGTDPVDPGTDPVDPGTDPVDPGTDPVDPGTDPVDPGTGLTPEEEVLPEVDFDDLEVIGDVSDNEGPVRLQLKNFNVNQIRVPSFDLMGRKIR